MKELQGQFIKFMGNLEHKLAGLGVSLFDYPIDHICYRVADLGRFEVISKVLKKASVLHTTKFFHERYFHLFVLKKPLTYKSIAIHFIEFAEPGGSDLYSEGFQHIELLTTKPLTKIVRDKQKLKKLLFEDKYGEEQYLKWPDKSAVKLTPYSIIIKSMLEDDPIITLNKSQYGEQSRK